MAKANITKKYSLSASGILGIEDNVIGIENPDSGEFINLVDLFEDFKDKSVKLSINYDEDVLA